ncbi:hypothetical protein SAMN05443428_12213 [Caloramator quimbayensis]|uniref:Uncharacterized protein n=1 Tax=Caloramator quimbayensis TaxID=1147123 RepID=A0A1T4Y4M1_9CLOT|nr:hypothetical protein [Caloramator quimbayensis]SKA96686.1 hypothetical protein SAMN05443428_12213 [Caloramator quimbayensis]
MALKKSKREDYLKKIYERNPDTGNYIIEVSLNKYTDIFNDWDNAPFQKRDLDPDLDFFLRSCSYDIPFKHDIEICFYISNEVRNEEAERLIALKLKNYYSFYLRGEIRVLRQSYRRVALYAFISFSLLFLALVLEKQFESNIFLNTALQGFNIGGWVLLWEAISFLISKRKDIINDINVFERYVHCDVYFKYSKD